MSFTVYILYSGRFQEHYTGFTTNLNERLSSHNKYGNDWTKAYRPWQLIYSKVFNTKEDALRYEKWLKTGIGRDFIKGMKC